jgi:hypothetical protein
VLLASVDLECSYEVLIIASMMASDMDLFRAPSARGKGGEEEVMLAEECKLKLAHHTGDHMTCLNVWNEWKLNDKNRQWCKSNYLNHKLLENAANVRTQLMDVMDKLKLKVVRGPTIKRKPKSSGKTRKRRMGENNHGESTDPVPVIRSFLSGYFTNIANKGANRAVFSHYSPDEHLAVGGNISSTALVALYLHPLCALSDMFDKNKMQYAELDWVMYTSITYTVKAVMKGVSKILWDWVKQDEGQARIKKLPQARLNGEAQPDVQTLDVETEQKIEEEKVMEEAKNKEEEENKKKRRADEIESIRQRALARRRH